MAASLVHALVQIYLADSASTDPISARLRTLCPALYTVEDSTSSKVHELLLAAGQQSKTGERERMVDEAVNLALSIASRLQLPTVVSHLAACQAYTRYPLWLQRPSYKYYWIVQSWEIIFLTHAAYVGLWNFAWLPQPRGTPPTLLFTSTKTERTPTTVRAWPLSMRAPHATLRYNIFTSPLLASSHRTTHF